MFRKLALVAAVALALTAGSAFAQFKGGMTLEQVQTEVTAQRVKGATPDAIATAAIKAGIAIGDLTVAMIIASGDPKLNMTASQVIQALIRAGGPANEATVIASAIGAGVDPGVVSAAAIAAGADPQKVAGIINTILGAQNQFVTRTSGGTPGGSGGGGGPGTTSSPF